MPPRIAWKTIEAEGREREDAHPAPRLAHQSQHHQRQGQHRDDAGGDAMAVLEADAALERRNQLAERERPVGHRESGAGRSDQSAHENQDEGRARGDYGDAMDALI